jgi:tetratricopeptide (TPR) repeat protein
MLVPLAGGAAYLLWQPATGLLIGTAEAQTNAGSRAPLASPAATPVSAPATAATPPVTNGAVAVLMERANFWRNQTQYDQALESLNRALALEPNNADALAMVGQIQADRGNRQAAEAALSRLRRAAPGDPRIDKIDQALKVGPIPQEALTDARRLARDGRLPEAIDRYNRVFRGNPPPDTLAVEYYQTLAGTEGGWEKARDGLANAVRSNPQDLRAQLAYAQILTYRDGARADGISRLSQLARNPSVAEAANQAWRQAVLWLPQDQAAVQPLQDYLSVHANDAEVAARLEAARNPPPDPNDPGAKLRIAAFDDLNHGKLTEAGTQFQSAIEANANDADAIGGLGLVRLRQRRLDEARTLLNRAIALDPANRGRWQPALNGASSAEAGSRPNPATVMMDRGEYAAAEAELRRQVARGSGDVAALNAMLADAQARQNKTAAAEASYRAALARNPRYAPALVGLSGILSQQGRHDEAIALLRQAEAVGGDRRLVGQARALQLREQAQTITDPATQAGLYRAAIAADPTSPWLKLDYARALVKQNNVREARSVMAQVVAGNPSIDALRAGIIFANETSDPDAASALLARVPPSQRTPDMRLATSNAALQREIGQVIDLPRTAARARLLAMAAVPDPDGARGAAIARALSSIGDSGSARRAIIVARDATPNQGNAARIAYAGALLDIGDATGAQVMLSPLRNGAGLTADQKTAFVQLRAGLAIKTSDDLNQAGKQAEAYDKLAPALAADPDNTDMNLALARLYAGAKNPKEALEINEALLRRDPTNAEARRGAVAAALQSGNRRRAEQLVAEGLSIAPDDPKSWMASADVARASGNNARALRDLSRARELRLQQLGYSDNGSDDSTLTRVTLMPGDDPIAVRSRAQVKVAQPGSRQAPSTATYVYPSLDHGDDPASPLAIPPDLSTRALPTPTRNAPAAAPVTAAPLPAPAPLRYTAPAAPAPTPAPASYAAPLPAPSPTPSYDAPRGRVLDTTQADAPLAPPARVAQRPSGAGSEADRLNAGQLGGYQQPSYAAPGYAAPQYPAPAEYAPPQYVQPQYAVPQYAPQPAYATPTYPAYGQPAYAPSTADYLPQYRPAPAPAPYIPPPAATFQPNAAVQPQVPQQLRYQPQIQEYLPQYRPAPAPTAGQAVTDSDAQFLTSTDFNRPQRPSLPRVADSSQPPFGNSAPSNTTGTVRFYDNPFRSTPDAALSVSGQSAAPGTGPDPVTQEIDRNIVQLRDSLAPSLQGGFGIRTRSGDAGLDKLTEVNTPIEATFSAGGTGQLRLSVTPVVLSSGTIGGDDTNLQRFGTLALGLTPPVQGPPYVPAYYTGNRPSTQDAQGVGLDVGYSNRLITADVGTSPVGFKVPNIIGGLEFAPQLNDRVRLRVGVERRSLTDSVLSYAGTTDPRTGTKWGGVVRNQAKIALEFSAGPADFYVNGGGGQVTGKHVTSNTDVTVGAGGSYPVYRQGDDEVRVGVDLLYLSYAKNLRFFTLGQGGYFSPQSYVSALIPVNFRSKIDEDTSYEVGAAVGYQTFSEKTSNYYPDDPSLQAQLNAATNFSGLSKTYPSRSQSGIAGNVHGKFDYRVSTNLHIGGQASYQHSGSFDEAVAGVYAKYLFNGTANR